ncbi:Single-stranded-DNA-specific exonuclease RecJ [Acaryochloris thomasi RCC1774]|uniref:Single-stranded-DNA-specific exonuclease RecJ n=1 Tax=Acaryochloris thomasi RCC1774 TaxID=1764569 RepID=A0A2W1JJY1_9CYAN|nr:single-stranded-DNA-specific exonuclease RecJ [Acaryochloris thomasi]PZD73699.1 Single-stranded-DNA-specific exonuclease RecJ [Acaryochloris thomasi RCC1774]
MTVSQTPALEWQTAAASQPPDWLIAAVRKAAPVSGEFAAQLLWQRGLQDPQQVAGFLDPNQYQPAPADSFGQEMQQAVDRLVQAREQQQKVAIWGDFDADGVTATAVLWDGLGQFFIQQETLTYTIPNRLIESHGLSRRGLDQLAAQNYDLIVTCDTGSTDLDEIHYAQQLGMDVIVTDHHTLPDQRPPVTAIINPRSLAREHPLAHLSGVAVAYKLVEAMYLALPDVPEQPLEHFLDLVAIGLIADLVQLSGDCRYLAQRGIEQLQQQLTRRTRPGVAKLLELCKRSGDRPTDISFGIGPRINAVSRIHGDASFCVELLTSQDAARCQDLAAETELANTRRKALQKTVVQQVTAKLEQLDLSTMQVIVLSDPQWPLGVLGLVAGQVAQTYGRPTILLSTDGLVGDDIARGSARSVSRIDLYELVKEQAHLLQSFGGHPFAAGMSLEVENILLFTEAINQQFRQRFQTPPQPTVQADLTITVADLEREGGQTLFKELKLLEPCGMGNPVPKLLIQNCWFENVWNRNIKDRRGNKVQYIKTEFELWDDTAERGFPGLWWGHYRDEVPQGNCDVIVELDFNSYRGKQQQSPYEVRLIAVRPAAQSETESTETPQILDWRQTCPLDWSPESIAVVDQCPLSWDQLGVDLQQAQAEGKQAAMSYGLPVAMVHEQQAADRGVAAIAGEDSSNVTSAAVTCWEQWVGVAKYLVRTGQAVTYLQLQQKLSLSRRTLELGIQTLESLGFTFQVAEDRLHVQRTEEGPTADANQRIQTFLQAVQEEQFQQQYFQTVPLETVQATAGLP